MDLKAHQARASVGFVAHHSNKMTVGTGRYQDQDVAIPASTQILSLKKTL